MAIKVALREKRISDNRLSLYLDFYPAIVNQKTGQSTRREFMGLYLFVDKDEIKKEIKEKESKFKDVRGLKALIKELAPLDYIQKQHNIDTLKLAQDIRQKKENHLNKPEIYSQFEKEQLRLKELGNKNFVDYFRKLAAKRKESNHDNWVSALNYLENFTKGEIKFSDLSESYLNEFKDFLLTTKSQRSKNANLSQNSAVSYFNKVKAALRQAYRDGILQTDLNSRISPIKVEETRREYLSLEELNKLVKTPCNDPQLKRAALFSALTGLRFSDIEKLTWGEIEFINDQGYFLKFTQKKTKGIEYYPISDQAFKLLGDPGSPSGKVFEELKYSAYQNKQLGQWLGAARITKDITFHCFRHTFATLQLFNGTDIYTVSKMLGHKDLKTTQVYAKIVDEAKRKASNKIILDL